LIDDVGLRPMWVGDLETLPVIEALAGLWFALALRQGLGRHLAFRTLRD
jgi:predicted dinucleotide-binding enzyme